MKQFVQLESILTWLIRTWNYCFLSLKTIWLNIHFNYILSVLINDNSHKIIIPEGVTYLRSRRFYQSNANTIHLPKSLVVLGEEAFRECAASVVTFDSDSQIKEISKSCFYKCERLNNIQLPKSVNIIREHSFQQCLALKNVKVSLPDQQVNICGYAFSGCRSLVTAPVTKRTTTISQFSFALCQALTIQFRELLSLVYVGQMAFHDCFSLKVEQWPAKLKHIGQYAFFNIADAVQVPREYCIANSGISVKLLPISVDMTKLSLDEPVTSKGLYDHNQENRLLDTNKKISDLQANKRKVLSPVN